MSEVHETTDIEDTKDHHPELPEMTDYWIDPGSFRDPSGFIFTRNGTLLRQVNTSYSENYDHLMNSGLYQALMKSKRLVSHVENDLTTAEAAYAYRLLCPERLPFISYPYEWCFSQLRDAGLATLQIQKEALNHGMTLKDASAYNIQFKASQPILIDTLSFEMYEEGKPWQAYRQFCQHFLAPLALMSRTDIRLQALLRTYIDGIPLDLASRLLPRGTWLHPGLLAHIHLHGAAQNRYADQPVKRSEATGRMSRTALLGLIDNLESTISKLTWKPQGTTWAEYYSETNYSEQAMDGKHQLVNEMLAAVSPLPRTVWDLGANTGSFSRLASAMGAYTIAWDIDTAAVEKNYQQCRSKGDPHLLPLLQDLTNPSPNLGWALQERGSLLKRGPADVTMALALIHHLAIGNNVPLDKVASFLRSVGGWLIVEFVPKNDSQVQRLLASREDIFTEYSHVGFETTFCRYFDIIRSVAVPDSARTLYLMRGHSSTDKTA